MRTYLSLNLSPPLASGLGLCLMVVTALIIFSHSISQTLAPQGGTDFHSYWYYGHFVWQKMDPYQAFFAHATPSVPITYLDKVIVEQLPIAKPGLARTPANTAPLVLLLSLFSRLSWPTAKSVWMIFNLLLTLIIPWLTIRLLPAQANLSRFQKGIIYFSFYVLQGTRIANWVGQTTVLVFILMLGTLLTLKRHRFLAGLMLGLAMSKYSLAMPIFLFVLFQQAYGVAAMSLLVQTGGLLAVSWLGHRSPLVVGREYFQMVLHHMPLPGIHLATLFPAGTITATIIVGIGSAALFMLLWHWRLRFRPFPAASPAGMNVGSFQVVIILTLWSLLAVYHRPYDTLAVILWIALLVYGLGNPNIWHLSQAQRSLFGGYLVGFIGVMSLPASLMGFVLPPHLMPGWYQLVNQTMTLTLLVTLSLSLWLLGRTPPLNAKNKNMTTLKKVKNQVLGSQSRKTRFLRPHSHK